MQKIASTLERTIKLLENSENSVWAETKVAEAKNILEAELNNFNSTGRFEHFGSERIKLLFLPTGTLQEISISNGWDEEYLRIAEIIDKSSR